MKDNRKDKIEETLTCERHKPEIDLTCFLCACVDIILSIY